MFLCERLTSYIQFVLLSRLEAFLCVHHPGRIVYFELGFSLAGFYAVADLGICAGVAVVS